MKKQLISAITALSIATIAPADVQTKHTKHLPKTQNPYFEERPATHYQLKFAKDVEPSIFENATPLFHVELLNFINGPEQFKAAAVFRGAAKSTLLNKILIINRIAFEYEPFTMIVSSDKEKAQSFLADIKNLIEKAQAKGYSLSKGDIWTQSKVEIIVNEGKKDKNGKSLEKRCFIAAFGAGQDPRGYTYKNVRPTLIIADDLESKNGQYAIANKRNRQKLKEWFYADLMPSLHPQRGQMVIIGTILHEDSILNNIIMEKEEEKLKIKDEDNKDEWFTHKSEWHTKVIPIMQNGKAMWKSRFSLKKIKALKSRLSRIGLENEFYQEYMCKAMAPEKQLFKKEFFNYHNGLKYNKKTTTLIVKDALTKKELQVPTPTHIIKENGTLIPLQECQIFSTMDLASYDGADRTAIITFAIDKHDDIYVLDITAGHWTPFEKGLQVVKTQLMFNPSRFGIEKASAQNDFFYTVDEIQKRTGISVPVEPLSHHSKSKNSRISNLHPLFIVGRLFFNKKQSSTTELESELLSFNPEVEAKHDDIIDALAYILEFIAGRTFEEDYEDEDFYDDDDFDDEWS